MKVIGVRIEGVKPILLHNPAGMAAVNPTPGKKYIPSPQEEAESGCYWNEDRSSLVLPSQNLYRAILKAAGSYKILSGGYRRSAATFIAGSIELDPFDIPFNTNEYGIDIRRANVQGNGVMRARPKLWPWALDFNILVEEEDVPKEALDSLRPMLEEAGRRIGIGDFRMEKMGPFGKFKVTRWEVQ